MFDLKTDLGYKRTELFNQAKERDYQVEVIRKSTANCNDGKTKVQKFLNFSDNLIFIYIVISQGNISKTTQVNFIKQIKQLSNVEIYLLTIGDHCKYT